MCVILRPIGADPRIVTDAMRTANADLVREDRVNLKRLGGLAVLAVASLFLLAACSGDDGGGSGGAADTLRAVMDRGEVRCGVNDAVPGFGFLQPDGTFAGFDVDFCRALAAAVFGDASKVEFVPLTAAARFEALSASEIDVLIRNTTWTADRDVNLSSAFTTVTFYDGQGMMVRANSGFQQIEDMRNATVCVLQGTTTELNLDDRFRSAGIPYTPLTFENNETLEQAFIQERCDGWTSDKSQLAARRSAFPAQAGGPEGLVILGETFSKEPLGPVTRDNDSRWYDVVNWTVIGMIIADELGVTSQNVAQMAANPPNADVARLLGVSFQGGEAKNFGFGIPIDFMQQVISQVGNYDEVYQRNVAPIGIERAGTLNASWLEGGILYSPPMR
jgi:general L-amino acid transport system substrate-binding protein